MWPIEEHEGQVDDGDHSIITTQEAHAPDDQPGAHDAWAEASGDDEAGDDGAHDDGDGAPAQVQGGGEEPEALPWRRVPRPITDVLGSNIITQPRRPGSRASSTTRQGNGVDQAVDHALVEEPGPEQEEQGGAHAALIASAVVKAVKELDDHVLRGEEGLAKARELLSDRDLRGLLDSNDDMLDDLAIKVTDDGDAFKLYDPSPTINPVRVPESDSELRRLSARDRALWQMADDLEWHGLATVNGTFEAEPWPIKEAKKLGPVLGHKWVRVVKADARLKSRLTARGDQDRDHVPGRWSSPTTCIEMVKLVFMVGLRRGWKPVVLDVEQAYLKGSAQRHVFIKPPAQAQAPPGTCLRIVKSMYGLAEAGYVWYHHLGALLDEFGLERSIWDPCIRFSDKLVTSLYVDDLPTMASPGEVERMREFLAGKDCKTTIQEGHGTVLGARWSYDESSNQITLDFADKEAELIKEFDPDNKLTPRSTPIADKEELPFLMEEGQYPRFRELVGALLFISKLRPDISEAVRRLCRHGKANGAEHFQAALRVLQYLKFDPGRKMILRAEVGPEPLRVSAYSDATWATEPETRKSVTGLVVKLNDSVLTAVSRTQKVVSKSSCESELYAIADAADQILFYRRILDELGEEQTEPSKLWTDSMSAMAVIEKPYLTGRSKHIDTRRLRLVALRDESVFDLGWVPSAAQLADPLTKRSSKNRLRDVKPRLFGEAVPGSPEGKVGLALGSGSVSELVARAQAARRGGVSE